MCRRPHYNKQTNRQIVKGKQKGKQGVSTASQTQKNPKTQPRPTTTGKATKNQPPGEKAAARRKSSRGNKTPMPHRHCHHQMGAGRTRCQAVPNLTKKTITSKRFQKGEASSPASEWPLKRTAGKMTAQKTPTPQQGRQS